MLFRKKPVVIEARQLTLGDFEEIVKWCGGYIVFTDPTFGKFYSIVIPTLEGDFWCELGSWIIKGVEGEFYPCKPDIFEATYEPVKEG